MSKKWFGKDRAQPSLRKDEVSENSAKPSENNDLGVQAIQKVYTQYKIDDEWSVREPRGFSWWGHRFRQKIWSEPGFDDGGITVFRLCARTDFVTELAGTDEIAGTLASLNRYASVASLTPDPDLKHISFFSSVYIHEQTADAFATNLFSQAAIIQPIMAEGWCDSDVPALFGGMPNTSHHPTGGQRVLADDMLNVISQFYAPVGESDSPWAFTSEFEETSAMLNQMNCYSSASPTGMTAEFAFGENDTAMLRAFGDIKNPQLGNGLMLQLYLPGTRSESETAELAQLLNICESHHNTGTHTLGAWTLDEVGGTHTLVFVTFIPAAMYNSSLLFNLTIGAGLRSRWAAELILGDDAGGSAIEIVTRRILAAVEPAGHA